MKIFDKILCPIDFSEDSVKALQWSEHLAKEHGSQVTILHVMEPYPAAVDVGIDYDKYHAAIVRDMRAFLAPLEIPFQSMQSSGSPSEKITTLARTLGSTLIIMGTRGLRGAAHRLIGSTAESVVRHSSVPVMTLSPQCLKFNEIQGIRGLLPFSKLDWPVSGHIRLRQVLRDLNGPINVMHVVDWKDEVTHPVVSANPGLVTNYQMEPGKQALQNIAAHLNKNGEPAGTILQFGEAAREILREADPSKYGCIVMGAKKQKVLSRFFGSTVYNIISQAPIPVFTIRI